jgi:hypothetical protein
MAGQRAEKVSRGKSVKTERYSLFLGDSCSVLPQLPAETVGLILYSPPFAQLFSYSDDPRDLSNSKDYEEFFEHYGYVVRETERLLMPGRVAAAHCMDLPTFKVNGEEIGLKDFPGDIIRCHEAAGFVYHSRFVIWKDPLVAATRTKAVGLAHQQLVKDSALCRTGIPDYVLAFRKKGENPAPIPHPDGLTEYHGARAVPGTLDRYLGHKDQHTNKRSHWIWQRYASPVWDDIRQTKVLPFKGGRDPDDVRHICPLQLDVVQRCLELWSRPGDVVLDPFSGVGSTVYMAVRSGRRGLGVELKPSYHRMAVRNLEALDRKMRTGFRLGKASGEEEE